MVKVTAGILSKMFAENSSYEVLEIVGYGSIWAWALDEITDNIKIDLKDKVELLDEYIDLLNENTLTGEVVLERYPETSIIIVDCINKIIKHSKLNSLDIKLLKEEYKSCLQGFKYEVVNMGKNVDIEDSLFYRSYSYVPPFYGAMIYVSDYHIINESYYEFIRELLKVFGTITRLHNDLATYKKERAAGEINIVLLLMKKGHSEESAKDVTKEYLARYMKEYRELASKVKEKKFIEVIDKFIEVHRQMYEIDNVRLIDPNTI